ncbi:MAG TPA: hypothetical protein VKI44_06085 [Acetobacteraceae bacterium]|nr:hypothetical protein [Acetobacteraceae bacterium]
MIDYGKELATTIRRRAFTDPDFVRSHFGTPEVAAILACISRGLHRAEALEARIVRNAARLDAAPRGAASARTPRAPRQTATPVAQEANPGLVRLPTPAQIAAEVRRRPIGAVLADICSDLGILPSDPLWRELQLAIIVEDGNLCCLVMDMTGRAIRAVTSTWPPGMKLTWPAPSPAPPPPQAPASPSPELIRTRPP